MKSLILAILLVLLPWQVSEAQLFKRRQACPVPRYAATDGPLCEALVKVHAGEAGSGTVLDDGTVLTAAHVAISNVASVYHKGIKYPGRVVKRSRELDLALIQLDGKIPTKGMSLGQNVGFVVNWAGHVGSKFFGSTAIIIKSGERLTFDRAVPRGTSGGPIWNSTGLVGVVCDTDACSNRSFGPGLSCIRKWLGRNKLGPTVEPEALPPKPVIEVPVEVVVEPVPRPPAPPVVQQQQITAEMIEAIVRRVLAEQRPPAIIDEGPEEVAPMRIFYDIVPRRKSL